MDNQEIAIRLKSLAQLDIDAVHAYTQALEQIEMAEIRDQLESFRTDHERHITDLSPLISRLGGEPPELTRDFKGFVIQGMTALRSVTGTAGALKAMRMNEALTNARYEAALQSDMPADVRAVVQRNRADERRHLSYIEQCIEEEPWEALRRPGAMGKGEGSGAHR